VNGHSYAHRATANTNFALLVSKTFTEPFWEPIAYGRYIAQLANMDPYPESVPINNLVKVEGTPLADTEDLDPLDFVRTIAAARITMPTALVRLPPGGSRCPMRCRLCARRRELHLLRRATAHYRQPGCGKGPRAARQARHVSAYGRTNVGWVERSDTINRNDRTHVVGIATLNPTYQNRCPSLNYKMN
jgi:hypothetical protein